MFHLNFSLVREHEMRGLGAAVRRPRRVLLAAVVHCAAMLGSIAAIAESSNSRIQEPAPEELAVIQGHFEASGEKLPPPPQRPDALQAGTKTLHPGEDLQCALPHAVVEDSWRHVVHGRNS